MWLIYGSLLRREIINTTQRMISSDNFGLKLMGTVLLTFIIFGCVEKSKPTMMSEAKTAAEILGHPDYLAMSYGGYRTKSREDQPKIYQIKEDLLLLHAMGVRIVRTYNMQFDHAPNVVKAIQELKNEDPEFEMYVMLGAWIDCANAWTDQPDHAKENVRANTIEIERAAALASDYPDIVKIIAVGNEAMVHWASSYFVGPSVILKWVNHLQELKAKGVLSQDLWVTSSDNFASWGGGGEEYHQPDLIKLIASVDYISMHTYAFHDTHYNAAYWKNAGSSNPEAQDQEPSAMSSVTGRKKVLQPFMTAAMDLTIAQVEQVRSFVTGLGIDKPIHIGETGWSSQSDGFFGADGSRAADQLKQAMYYETLMGWCREQNMSCFFFEAFDEQWKSSANPSDPENHFGLFELDGSAKYVLWPLVDQGIFEGLSREGQRIKKTFDGQVDRLIESALIPQNEKLIKH